MLVVTCRFMHPPDAGNKGRSVRTAAGAALADTCFATFTLGRAFGAPATTMERRVVREWIDLVILQK